MAGSNNFKIFNEANGSEESDATYLADVTRLNGISPGIAPKELYNKLFRQVSIMASAIGEVVKAAGFVASDADLTALVSALNSTFITPISAANTNVVYPATGDGNIIAVNTGATFIKAFGKKLSFKANATNTGNVTINPDGTGAAPALQYNGAQIAAGQMIANKVYDFYYDPASGGSFFLIAKASGNAVAGDLLAGKTASTDLGNITGTMVDNGPTVATEVDLTTQNATYVIPAGKQSGLRTIKAVISNLVAGVIAAGQIVGGIAGNFTANATAVAANILSGKTAGINGVMVSGTMPYRNNTDTGGSYPVGNGDAFSAGLVYVMPPAGYYDGTTWVKFSDSAVQANNIKAGVTFGTGGGIQLVGTGPKYSTGDKIYPGAMSQLNFAQDWSVTLASTMMYGVGLSDSQGNFYGAYSNVYQKYNASNGGQAWSFNVGTLPVAEASIDKLDNIYICTMYTAYKLNTSGTAVWTISGPGGQNIEGICVTPDGSKVYLTCADKKVYSIDPATGVATPLFTYNASTPGWRIRAPGDGYLYINDLNGTTQYLRKMDLTGVQQWQYNNGASLYTNNFYTTPSGYIFEGNANKSTGMVNLRGGLTSSGVFTTLITITGGIADLNVNLYEDCVYAVNSTAPCSVYKVNVSGTTIWSYPAKASVTAACLSVDSNGGYYVAHSDLSLIKWEDYYTIQR